MAAILDAILKITWAFPIWDFLGDCSYVIYDYQILPKSVENTFV